MTENESSPSWLLPLIVVILIASVVLLFVASRPPADVRRPVVERPGFVEGPTFNLTEFSSPTDPVDPCSLIEQSEVEELLGQEVSTPRSEPLDNPFGEVLCMFSEPDDVQERLVVIDMVFQQGMAPIITESDYDIIELYRGRKVLDRGLEDVSGIQDEAFWGGVGTDIWNGLHAHTADVYTRVIVNLEDDDRAFEAAREIMVLVLEDLFG